MPDFKIPSAVVEKAARLVYATENMQRFWRETPNGGSQLLEWGDLSPAQKQPTVEKARLILTAAFKELLLKEERCWDECVTPTQVHRFISDWRAVEGEATDE